MAAQANYGDPSPTAQDDAVQGSGHAFRVWDDAVPVFRTMRFRVQGSAVPELRMTWLRDWCLNKGIKIDRHETAKTPVESMSANAYVYIMASKGRRLYVGVTTGIEVRVAQHKLKTDPASFTARYNINQLVYLERFDLILAAIAREKELKGWTRQRKIALVVASNPRWEDLSLEWGNPVKPFREEDMRPARRFGK